MKYVTHESAACKISHIQEGEGMVFHVGSKYTWYAYFRELRVLTHALLLRGNSHLNTLCDEVIPICEPTVRLAQCSRKASASMSWTSKQSMNKTTLVASSVRMGVFNFPVQISRCTTLNFSAVYQFCCLRGCLSQGALLSVACPCVR